MEVAVRFEVIPAGRSVLATSSALKLSALGSYTEEAITRLVQGVTAWCLGLREMGVLQEVLDRRGVEWSGDPKGVLRVTPVISE